MDLSAYPLVVMTGATGWLGGRVARALTAGLPELGDVGRGGLRLRCLVLPQEAEAARGLGAEIVVGDVRDPEACRRLLAGGEGALVVHIAGIIHPAWRTREFDEVNVEGTRNVLEASRAAGAARIVAMSSNSPLGCNPSPADVFTEDSAYHPYMGYGRSKWRMEMLLRRAAEDAARPEIVIVRAPWFYGPGQPPRQTLFFRMIREGRFPLLGDGDNRRSLGYVDSLAQGMLLAAVSPRASGQVYWLADERAYSMREIVDTVRAVLRDDFGLAVAEKTMRLPAAVGDVAELADRVLQASGVYVQKVHVLSEMNKTIACSIARARAELGYRPIVELREGMRRSVRYCLDNRLAI
jgi:nucleoside-diphosphate-sugar epimerase